MTNLNLSLCVTAFVLALLSPWAMAALNALHTVSAALAAN